MCSKRGILTDKEERISFRDDCADAANGDGVTVESRIGGIGKFRRDGDQQAAGGLGIEEEVTIFLRNTVGKIDAIANKIAVILQPAWEETFARGIDSAGKIGKR